MSDEFRELFDEWGYDAQGLALPLIVERHLGDGRSGPVYAAPEHHDGLPQVEAVTLVRSPDGNELTSQATVWAPIGLRDAFPLHSRVTFASGRVAVVSVVAAPSVGGDIGLECVVVSCA